VYGLLNSEEIEKLHPGEWSFLSESLLRIRSSDSQVRGIKRPEAKDYLGNKREGWIPRKLVTAATAAAAAASAAGGTARGRSRAAVACCGEDGELDGRLFAGALGAGDFLLLVDDDFLESGLAVFADVFIDGHRMTPVDSL
jgi:hypothetical protein